MARIIRPHWQAPETGVRSSIGRDIQRCVMEPWPIKIVIDYPAIEENRNCRAGCKDSSLGVRERQACHLKFAIEAVRAMK